MWYYWICVDNNQNMIKFEISLVAVVYSRNYYLDIAYLWIILLMKYWDKIKSAIIHLMYLK